MKKLNAVFTVTFIMGVALLFYGCKKDSSSHEGHETKQSSTMKGKYHCPMHPTYVADKPGDCPICNMRLVPIESQESHEQAVKETGDQAGPSVAPSSGTATDRVPVILSPEKQQLIGVRTQVVSRRNLDVIIRASGRIAYDPDLYNAIAEHRQAIQTREKVKESPWPDVQERSEALVNSSKLRLRQMGLSQNQIEALASKTEDPTNLLLSEKGGLVWVYAQVYEYEAGLVKAGHVMEVTSPSFPGKSVRGKVVAVDSILDTQTRTLKVRGEVPNLDGMLKPEMYVDALIRVDLGQQIAIPEEAVLKTGTRQLVFVETSAGRFEPREVKLGRKAEDHYEVISGLKEGEKVVTSANFLIDSESKLKAALSQTGSGHQH